jgi:plastocyanin
MNRALTAAALCCLLTACSGGSDPVGTPSAPTPPAGSGGTPAPPAPAGTTVAITAAGLSPQSITIAVGSRVTFMNQDSRPHDVAGGPDPSRPDCPEVDAAGFIAPGQSRQTAAFTTPRTCEYHNHAYLGVAAFQGRIVVQ